MTLVYDISEVQDALTHDGGPRRTRVPAAQVIGGRVVPIRAAHRVIVVDVHHPVAVDVAEDRRHRPADQLSHLVADAAPGPGC